MTQQKPPAPPANLKFRWLTLAWEREQCASSSSKSAAAAGAKPKRSILEDYPDLVDRAIRQYPEAILALRQAIKEWYAREDALART
jgi:hypothetical protein